MVNLLFGLIAGSGLTWVFISLRRDRYWHEYTTRHCQGGEITRAEWEAMSTCRGSNPPPPGTKPQPPGGRLIGPGGVPVGYCSISYPDPSPDRRPTNPFNGERIPNPPPREP